MLRRNSMVPSLNFFMAAQTPMFSTFFQKLDKESHEKMKWEFYKVPEHSKID